MSITRLHSNARMSQTVVHGGTIYLSGQIAPEEDPPTQNRAILASIDRLLAEAFNPNNRIASAFAPVKPVLGRGPHMDTRSSAGMPATKLVEAP